MKSSWRIGRIAGIEVHLHFTFLILLGWVAVSHYLQRKSWPDALGGLGFTLSLFTIVVLHELGHALMARRFGIRTRDITLLPIGGVARLDRIPEQPRQELLVALAGPAVNVVLALLLFGVLTLAGLPMRQEFNLAGGSFLARLFWVNISLAAFNLVPAFPMDGGRVLRAALATRMEYVRATQIAATIGQGMAWIFGFIGLFTNPFLVFIAFFVWMGAVQEAGFAQMKSALAGLPVERVMMTEFRRLAPGDPLAEVVDHVLAGSQQDFPVVESGHLVGLLTRADLVAGLARSGPSALVADVMQAPVRTAGPTELVESVMDQLQEKDLHTLPVVRNGALVGLLTSENLGEYLMVHEALTKSKTGAANARSQANAELKPG